MAGIEIEGIESTLEFLGTITRGLSEVPRVVERSAVNTMRDHFSDLGANRPNRLGAPSTGYWMGAAEDLRSTATPDEVTVSTGQPGIRHHYEGGEIRPVEKDWLTIPAIAEAHGKRAGEFTNLVFMWNPDKDLPRLADKDDGTVYFWLAKSVHKEADPSVLPEEETILSRINDDLTLLFGDR